MTWTRVLKDPGLTKYRIPFEVVQILTRLERSMPFLDHWAENRVAIEVWLSYGCISGHITDAERDQILNSLQGHLKE